MMWPRIFEQIQLLFFCFVFLTFRCYLFAMSAQHSPSGGRTRRLRKQARDADVSLKRLYLRHTTRVRKDSSSNRILRVAAPCSRRKEMLDRHLSPFKRSRNVAESGRSRSRRVRWTNGGVGTRPLRNTHRASKTMFLFRSNSFECGKP